MCYTLRAMKKISLILLTIASLSFGGCKFRSNNAPNNPTQDVSDVIITLNTTSMGLLVGDTQKLEVSLSRQVSYSFASSDTNVATIGTDGLVTARGRGNCLVRAYLNDDPNMKALCSVSVMDDSDLVTMSFSNISFETDYHVNYFTKTYQGTKFAFYRLAGSQYTPSDSMIMLYPNGNVLGGPDDNPYLPGALYNETALFGIRKLEIEYRGEGQVRYGMDRDLPNANAVPYRMEMDTFSMNFPANTNYLAIEALSNLCIKSITIKCLSGGAASTAKYTYEGKRAAPSRFLNPSEGEVASMPIKVKYNNDGSYRVEEWKNYVYHSSSYVINNDLDPAYYSYTEPVDIANYYYLFGAVPPNFGYNNYFDSDASYSPVLSRSTILNHFGYDYARNVSTYDRESGYAKSVPYKSHGSSGLPLYIEFDIDLYDDYTIYNRDVGRMVTWIDGFSCYSDSGPVSTFTGDHYWTFWEYDNMGGFNHEFDGEFNTSYRTHYVHSPATTYSLS